MLTKDNVRKVLDYDPETGELRWLIRPANCIHVGDAAGYNHNGYIRFEFDGERYFSHNVIWLWMTGEWPSNILDHRDCNGLNNRWGNLRAATPMLNNANNRKARHNTSGLKGVSFYKYNNKWRAQISINNQRKHIGYYDTREQAHDAYMNVAKSIRGEFARAE